MHQIIPVKNSALSPYIHSYNHFDLDMSELASSNKMVPDALADIWIITKNNLMSSSDNEKFQILPRVMVWGLYNRCSFLKSEGVVEVFSIKIYPWAFSLFFNYSLLHLQNAFCDLRDILPKQNIVDPKVFNSLVEQEKKVEHIEHHLINMLNPSRKINDLVASTYRKIGETEANVKINDLAQAMRVSRQYLNNEFKNEIGLNLKEYITVYRMRLCIDFQLNNHLAKTTELAYQFGFFDQSHFIHQFKKIVGETPKVFFSKRHLIKQHLRG